MLSNSDATILSTTLNCFFNNERTSIVSLLRLDCPFQMFSSSDAAAETLLPKWLNDSSLCDLSNEQLEIECVSHGDRAVMAAGKWERRIRKG